MCTCIRTKNITLGAEGWSSELLFILLKNKHWNNIYLVQYWKWYLSLINLTYLSPFIRTNFTGDPRRWKNFLLFLYFFFSPCFRNFLLYYKFQRCYWEMHCTGSIHFMEPKKICWSQQKSPNKFFVLYKDNHFSLNLISSANCVGAFFFLFFSPLSPILKTTIIITKCCLLQELLWELHVLFVV